MIYLDEAYFDKERVLHQMDMQNIDHLSPEEKEHFIRCECGSYVDMRNLSDVFRHLHTASVPEPQWSHSIRKGDVTAYTRKGEEIGLN